MERVFKRGGGGGGRALETLGTAAEGWRKERERRKLPFVPSLEGKRMNNIFFPTAKCFLLPGRE